jgi:hypothetical protein
MNVRGQQTNVRRQLTNVCVHRPDVGGPTPLSAADRRWTWAPFTFETYPGHFVTPPLRSTAFGRFWRAGGHLLCTYGVSRNDGCSDSRRSPTSGDAAAAQGAILRAYRNSAAMWVLVLLALGSHGLGLAGCDIFTAPCQLQEADSLPDFAGVVAWAQPDERRRNSISTIRVVPIE